LFSGVGIEITVTAPVDAERNMEINTIGFHVLEHITEPSLCEGPILIPQEKFGIIPLHWSIPIKNYDTRIYFYFKAVPDLRDTRQRERHPLPGVWQ
jgi:hypothetical protein